MLCRGNLHQEYAVLAVKNLCARHQNVNVELQLASVGLDVGVQPLNAVTEEPLSKWMTRCKKRWLVTWCFLQAPQKLRKPLSLLNLLRLIAIVHREGNLCLTLEILLYASFPFPTAFNSCPPLACTCEVISVVSGGKYCQVNSLLFLLLSFLYTGQIQSYTT